MLACDIVVETRASRSISAGQVAQLERLVFGAGHPGPDHIELLFLIDGYILRADKGWRDLLARAAEAAHDAGIPTPHARSWHPAIKAAKAA